VSWTYTGAPATVALDAVRFEVGDTDTADQLFSDAELQYLLDRMFGDVLMSSADAASQLAARYARRADSESNGDLAVSWGNASARMLALAKDLRDRAANTTGAPSGFGLADEDEYDRSPTFWLGRWDSGANTILDQTQT
jgi:hypothetical protein